nr:endonuclease [Zea mays]
KRPRQHALAPWSPPRQPSTCCSTTPTLLRSLMLRWLPTIGVGCSDSMLTLWTLEEHVFNARDLGLDANVDYACMFADCTSLGYNSTCVSMVVGNTSSDVHVTDICSLSREGLIQEPDRLFIVAETNGVAMYNALINRHCTDGNMEKAYSPLICESHDQGNFSISVWDPGGHKNSSAARWAVGHDGPGLHLYCSILQEEKNTH